MAITYVKGDATKPQGDGTQIIAHIVNTGNDFGRGHQGVWGGGFTASLDKQFPLAGRAYKGLVPHFRDYPAALLGTVQLICVVPSDPNPDDTDGPVYVANMFGQVYGTVNGQPPIRYGSLGAALARLGVFASEMGASIHMPRIGTGLAGGEWSKVEPLIDRYLGTNEVFVYDYEPEPEPVEEEEEDEWDEDEDWDEEDEDWDEDEDEEDWDEDEDEDEEDWNGGGYGPDTTTPPGELYNGRAIITRA
jgi:O-acetyl-ADP-ribose deacetylase (regulator of RNase III)